MQWPSLRHSQCTLSGDSATPRAPASAEAYEKFLQAEFFYYRRAPGDVERALRLHEQAVALDPQFARAWASLAGAYSYLGFDESGPSPRHSREATTGCAPCRRAGPQPRDRPRAPRPVLQRERKSGEGQRTHGESQGARPGRAHGACRRGRLGRSTKTISRQPSPCSEASWHATRCRESPATTSRSCLLVDGQYQAALSEFRKVQEIHPESDAGMSREIAPVLVLLRRFDEAGGRGQRAAARQGP